MGFHLSLLHTLSSGVAALLESIMLKESRTQGARLHRVIPTAQKLVSADLKELDIFVSLVAHKVHVL